MIGDGHQGQLLVEKGLYDLLRFEAGIGQQLVLVVAYAGRVTLAGDLAAEVLQVPEQPQIVVHALESSCLALNALDRCENVLGRAGISGPRGS